MAEVAIDLREMRKALAGVSPHYATKLVVQEVGGIDAAASLAGVSRSLIHRYTDTNNPPPASGRKTAAPVDVALILERAAKKPHITRWLAAEQGYSLVPARASEDRSRSLPTLNRVAAEEAMKTVCMGNRTLDRNAPPTRADIAALREQVRHEITALANMDAALTDFLNQLDRKE